MRAGAPVRQREVYRLGPDGEGEEPLFALLPSALRRIRAGIKSVRGSSGFKELQCCDTHMYSTYNGSRHNILTAVGAIRHS